MALTQDGALKLLKRWQGSGYASGDDSVRVRELSAIGKIAAMVSEAVDAARVNLLIQTADEALDALERTRFLVAQSSLTPERRRARLHVFARAAAKLVGPRLAHAFAEYLGDATGATMTPDGESALLHRASPLSGLLVARREPAGTEEQARRDLLPALERGLPARALLGGISSVDAAYGVPFSPGAMALVETPAVEIEPQTKARAAPLEFYPGSAIARASWIELQSMVLWKSRGFSLEQSDQGRTVFCDIAVGSGESALIDGPTANDGIDWRDRIVQAWGTIAASASEDMASRTAAEHVWLSAMKLGSGNTHEPMGLAGSGSDVTITVDASGNLVVTNDSVDARYCTLLLRSTPVCLADTTDDTQPWIHADAIVADELAELYRSTVISDDEPGSFAGVPAGALRRLVYTGALSREAGAHKQQKVLLDSSEDWRSRFVLVAPLTQPGPIEGELFYPEAGSDGLVPRTTGTGAPRMFFTGDGTLSGESAVLPYQHADTLSSPNVWLYADVDGNLCAEMKPGSSSPTCCLMALIIATERAGGQSVVTPVPVHATLLQTIDLEQPQNTGCFAQGFQGGVPRYSLISPQPRAIPTAPPLGLISEGHAPPRPVSWLVRERLGSASDERYEVRQKIVGQRKRLISLELPPESRTPVDDFDVASELMPGVNDQLDFRDRLVWIEGAFSTDDIRLGASSQLSDESATRFFALLYTGPNADVEVAISAELTVLFAFSKSGDGKGYHSRLLLRNTTEDTYYVNAAIECSGFTGLTDLRQYGVINVIECASGDELETDEGRGFADDFKTTGGVAARAPGES